MPKASAASQRPPMRAPSALTPRQAPWRIGRESSTFEGQGGDSAGGVHEEVDGVEGATEDGDAEVLKEFDGSAEEMTAAARSAG